MEKDSRGDWKLPSPRLSKTNTLPEDSSGATMSANPSWLKSPARGSLAGNQSRRYSSKNVVRRAEPLSRYPPCQHRGDDHRRPERSQRPGRPRGPGPSRRNRSLRSRSRSSRSIHRRRRMRASRQRLCVGRRADREWRGGGVAQSRRRGQGEGTATLRVRLSA